MITGVSKLNPAPTFGRTLLEQIEALLCWRRDVRHFQPCSIPEADMALLLRLAHHAPSVGNSQPWRFVRVRSSDLRAKLADHTDAVSADAANRYQDDERQRRYRLLKLHGIREAPELLAVFSDDYPEAGHGLGIATMAEMLRYSTVIAIHTLWLAARAKGIGVGWVSILDPAYVTAMLDVPDSWALVALLCIGYPAVASNVAELEQRGWQKREPWASRVFER